MKSVAPFAIALLLVMLVAACSSGGLSDERVLTCGPGQDIEVVAGLGSNIGNFEPGMDERFDLLVEVANNSHGEVTVKSIRADQAANENALYRLDSGYGEFNQVIEEGKDHTFTLPMRGRWLRELSDARRGVTSGSSDALELWVLVQLTNGDSYRCRFELGGR